MLVNVTALAQALDEEMSKVTEGLNEGAATSHNEYVKIVGYYQGLKGARAILEDLVEKARAQEVDDFGDLNDEGDSKNGITEIRRR